MNAKKPSTERGWTDPDDAPDLSAPEWRKKFSVAHVRRGRPKAEKPKVSTTIRLDADIVDYFRAGGPGWQSRINETLRRSITKRAGN